MCIFSLLKDIHKTDTGIPICEIIPDRSIGGVAIGFTNMIVMQTGVLFHPIFGFLLNYSWNGETILNNKTQTMVPLYMEDDYRFAFSIIPICIIIAIFLIIMIKETHPGRHS